MPAITPVVLTDGTTPVTFKPIGRNGDQTVFRTTSAVNLAAQSELKVTSSYKGSHQRIILKYTRPETETSADTGETVVVENALAEFNVRIPSGMTSVEREAFIKTALSALSDTSLDAVLVDGEGFWS
jgi:hypothetical protein